MRRVLFRTSVLKTLIGFAITLQLAGCGRPERTTPSQYECVGAECEDIAGTACVSALDCAESQTCEAGVCVGEVARQACQSSNDCAFGMHCDLRANFCVNCLMDEHCDVGLVCQADGTCGDGSVECGGDYDCPSGYFCDAQGACVMGSTSGGGGGSQDIPCEVQEDCDVYGRICERGACVPCSSDAQCKAGYICSAGTCTDPASGGGGGGGGFPGGGGGGVPGIPGMCTTAYDCPEGQGCFMGTICGMCLMPTDCRDGERCDISTMQCVGGESSGGGGGGGGGMPGGGGGSCDTAYDCEEGQGCLFGMCGFCMENTDCRDGQTCDQGSFQCL